MAKETNTKLYYDISEVSKITDVKPYVLRYWETEFPTLHPLKTAKGQRKYKQKDIDQIQQIKELLHNQSYTIAGARKKLGREDVIHSKKKDLLAAIEHVKKELTDIRELLDKPTSPPSSLSVKERGTSSKKH